MFEKKIACEDAKTIDAEQANLERIFHKAGREELTEFEIWRVARDLHLPTPKNISKYCSVDNGVIRLKG